MNAIYRTLLIGLSGCFLSCSDFLDLMPKNELGADEFYQTAEQFESALSGAYSILQEGEIFGDFYIFAEIPSDNTRNVLSGSVTDQDEFDKFYIRTTNPIPAGFWNVSYRGINRVNTILGRIDGIEMDHELKARYKLEAKFLRALLYFNLVRVFGDVPLVLTEITIDEAYQYQREPLEKVYAQIIADLQDAESLPASYARDPDIGRATSGAAKSLLGKVYLTLQNYAEAESKLAEVVGSGMYALLENTPGTLNIDGYASAFHADNHNSKEAVFEIQFKKGGYGEGNKWPNSFAPENSGSNVVPVGGTWGNNLPEVEMYESYEEGDLRRDFSIGLGYYDARKDGEWVPSIHVRKYFDTPYQNEDSNNNFPVIRYADVLLMYAEALNQNGKTALACDYLNPVRRRGFGYQTTESCPQDIRTSDKNEFFLVVEHERRVELAFECHRWFDLIRTGRAVEVMTSKGFKLNPTNLVCPVPQKQIDVNPALTQNEYIITPK
ncbi:MAG: RagB/SusD family nutrient uptake outer membrane protein [Tannerellaceae bacterium]|nr:RagB/SusD family nutrient uptake outer membrane protein [Tannerellaceae bacterium]